MHTHTKTTQIGYIPENLSSAVGHREAHCHAIHPPPHGST
jgi:hypothetical protein